MRKGLIEIVRYNAGLKECWDRFVGTSKNGTFLFNRDYMDYHADRFPDYSFIFFRKSKPYCILPGCWSGEIFSSHSGLTYGGFIMGKDCTTKGMMEVLELLIAELKSQGFKRLVYKPVPYIYDLLPSQEDLYCLFRHGAVLKARLVASVLEPGVSLSYKKDRRSAIRKSEKAGIRVTQDDDYARFWPILDENLKKRYNVKPVHSLNEMEYLHSKFPRNIKLFTAFQEEELLAGTVVYLTDRVLHTQYIASTHRGKKTGAVDSIINHLIQNEQGERFLDFGTSCENEGRDLNESLIYYKEGFGGRGVCYDTYELKL